jgi:hypothetical protein
MPYILEDALPDGTLPPPRALTPIEAQQLQSTQSVPGKTVIDDAEAQQILNQEAHPGVLSALGTGLEAAGSTATLGISRELENASQIPLLSSEEQQGRIAAHPLAKSAGTAAGFLVPGALEEGGARLGVEGLGALTPLGAVGEAGAAAGEAAPGIAGMIARGGVEGALLGAGNAIDEHALGSPDDLADSILSQGGLSMIAGGVLGAGLFGIKSLISPALKAATESSEASHGILARLWAGAASKATGASTKELLDGLDKASAATAPGVLDAAKEEAANATASAEAAQEKAARNASATLARHFQNLYDYSDNAGKSGFDGLRDEAVNALAPQEWKPQTLFNKLGANLNSGFGAVETMLTNPAEFGTATTAKAIRALGGLTDRIASFVDRDTEQEIKLASDAYTNALKMRLKDPLEPGLAQAALEARTRFVNAIANASKNLTNPDTAAAAIYKELYGLKQAAGKVFGKVPFGIEADARNLFNEKFLDPMTKLTTDSSAWGKELAGQTAAYNEIVSKDIDARKAFASRFMDKVTGKASPEKLSKWLAGAAKAGEAGADEATMPGTTGVVRQFQASAERMIAQEQKMRAMLSPELTTPERRAFVGRVWDTMKKGAVGDMSPEEVKVVNETWDKLQPALERGAKYTDGMKLGDAALQAHADAYDKFMSKLAGPGEPVISQAAQDALHLEKLRQFGDKNLGVLSTGGLGYAAYKLGIPRAVLLPVIAARMLYRAVTNPYSTINAYGKIARIHELMASKIESGIGAIFKGAHIPLIGAAGAALVHQTAFQTPAHPNESRSDAYQRHANDLSTTVAQGAPASGPISALSEHAPNLALAVGANASGLTHDLAARLPGIALPSAGRPPSGPNDVAFAKYARALEVAEKGTLHVLGLASQRKLTIDEARMWKKNFPAHAQMVARAIQGQRMKQKEQVPFSTEQTLSLLTNPEVNLQRGALTARLQQNFQNEHMKATTQKGSDKGLPKFAAMTTTKWANTAEPGDSQGA